MLSSQPERTGISPDGPRAEADANENSSKTPRHSPTFDLAIAQVSLALEVACYALVPAIARVPIKWQEPAYVFLTVLASCGAGFGPAIQALAVDVHSHQRNASETGRLFGVLSVVQAVRCVVFTTDIQATCSMVLTWLFYLVHKFWGQRSTGWCT